MSFQENLKYYRTEKGMTKASFAKKLGLIYTTYDNYERGTVEPKVSTLIKIADILNISTDDLLGRKNNAPNRINALPLMPTKFKLEPLEQLKIAAGEMVEAANACFVYSDRRHFLEELCDVQVAIETLKVHNFTEEEIAAMHKYVNQKNRKRGYL